MTRRRFLGTTAATTCGILTLNSRVLGDDPVAAQSDFPSTEHFWYRLQPAGPYIDTQRDNKAFGFTDSAVLLSEDNARTWPYSLAFPEARHITFSHIFQNGNILFSTAAQLYLSTDNLKTCRPITVKDAEGRDYLPHTPKNADHPGWYFHPLCGVNSWDVNGVEMLVWGNYCNVMGGAVPVNIFYSTDNGQTVKIAYAFGQNPHFRDDGSAGGGETGTLLGDARNPVICRHIHCVAYNPAENAFYACTGDIDKPEGHECHWLRGTYDPTKDQWQWTVIVSSDSNSRYKCGGINFVDGMVYWIADANGLDPLGLFDRGVFRCAPADIANPAGAHDAVQPGVRVRQYDHPGRRDPGRALRHRLALHTGTHHLPGYGQDLGAIRSQGVR